MRCALLQVERQLAALTARGSSTSQRKAEAAELQQQAVERLARLRGLASTSRAAVEDSEKMGMLSCRVQSVRQELNSALEQAARRRQRREEARALEEAIAESLQEEHRGLETPQVRILNAVYASRLRLAGRDL